MPLHHRPLIHSFAKRAQKTAHIHDPRVLFYRTSGPLTLTHSGTLARVLYIGAVLELSGYAIEFNEPDLILKEDGLRIGIAAKRPRSRGSVEKNVKKACKQVKRSNIDQGLIALDLSLAILGPRLVKSTELDGAGQFLERILSRYVSTQIDNFRRWCLDAPIRGLMLYALVPAVTRAHEARPSVTSVFSCLIVSLEILGPEYTGSGHWAERFALKMERGLFGEST